jgi:hypothetical protein
MTLRLLSLVFLILPLPVSAQAIQMVSHKISPRITVGDTLAITVSPAAVSFALQPAKVALGANTVNVTTSYSGVSLLSSLAVYGMFGNASAALSGGSPAFSIPSSAVIGLMPTGAVTSWTPFTQTAPLGGANASLQLVNVQSLLNLNGSRTDALSLKIDLTTLPQTPAATYTGTLMIEAQAF